MERSVDDDAIAGHGGRSRGGACGRDVGGNVHTRDAETSSSVPSSAPVAPRSVLACATNQPCAAAANGCTTPARSLSRIAANTIHVRAAAGCRRTDARGRRRPPGRGRRRTATRRRPLVALHAPAQDGVRYSGRQRGIADGQSGGEHVDDGRARAAFANCSAPPNGGSGNAGAVSPSRARRQPTPSRRKSNSRPITCGTAPRSATCSRTLAGTAESPITTGLPGRTMPAFSRPMRRASRRATRGDRDRC